MSSAARVCEKHGRPDCDDCYLDVVAPERPAAKERAVQCPDGSWSRDHSRRCQLPMGHAGPHRYKTTEFPAGQRRG